MSKSTGKVYYEVIIKEVEVTYTGWVVVVVDH